MHILFDLDGTLTDPGEGITNSIRFALGKMGKPVPPRRSLYPWIGPPLTDSFQKFAGLSLPQAQKAVTLYREYFSKQGIFENTLYEGIDALLASLQDAGHKLYLATSKPEEYAVQILEHFNILRYFDRTVGNTLAEERPTKTAVIRYLRTLVPEIQNDNAVMVGDRKYDVTGAHEAGIACVGVLYGYGTLEELQTAGADYLADSVPALAKILEEM